MSTSTAGTCRSAIRRGSPRPSWARGARRTSAPGTSWSDSPVVDEAPDAVDALFDEVIGATLASLPDEFFQRLGSVAIVVEDEPTADQLASVGAHGLYGLYQGIPRTRFGADLAPVPSKITLFRGPLLRSVRTPQQLALAVEDTLLHEIAHHFGIDDDRLRELRRH